MARRPGSLHALALAVLLMAAIAVIIGSCDEGMAPSSVPPSPTPGAPTPRDVSPAHLAAIRALADSLGLQTNRVVLIRAEATDWPDGCLGVRRAGVMCTRAVTPGFRIVLEAEGVHYEYHTNADGSLVLPDAGGPVTTSDSHELVVAGDLAPALGIPISRIKVVDLTMGEWPDACLGVSLPGVTCAEVATAGYVFTLEAEGMQYEYHTNQDASVIRPATLGLAFHREGGVAGFCDGLVILLPDQVQAASCKRSPSEVSLRAVAREDELARFYRWLEDYGTVTAAHQDQAVADAMTITLTLYGRGDRQPTDAEQQEMLSWAQILYERVFP
jgi:hypothetical protein